MDTDELTPPSVTAVKPRDRIWQRLVRIGVSEECSSSCLVSFLRENPSRVSDLVSAILPLDDEVAEAMLEIKPGSKKASSLTMKPYFRECMGWLQVLMFLGEPSVALKTLSKLNAGSRGVCGAVWGNQDIAYRCRTCEHDPTCAICVPCFQNGNHKDHDYSIIYTGGGCCDCGDVTAWKRDGFCSKHKGAEKIQPLPEEYANSVGPVLDALFICWKNRLLSAESVSTGNSKTKAQVVLPTKYANELTFVLVEMLLEFCKFSESLLSFVSKKVFSLPSLLNILVRTERFLNDGVAKKLNELLLKLLGEPTFKYEFGKVFLSYYPDVIHEVIKEGGDSSLKNYPLLSTFSVQILTVPTLTPRLVKEMNLLAMLLECLEDIFIHCAGDDGCLQATKWSNLFETTIRVVEDIRFVLSHSIVPQYVMCEQKDIIRTWLRLLSYLQGMNPLKRETGQHIEEENEATNYLFHLDHYVANIRSLLVDGAFSCSEQTDDDEIFPSLNEQDTSEEDSMRHAKVGRLSQECSVRGVSGRSNSIASSMQVSEVASDSTAHPLVSSSVTRLMYECLKAIDGWLQKSGVLSSVNISSSNINILALKNTFLKLRKGKSIFGGFTSSNEGQNSQCIRLTDGGSCTGMDAEITKSTGPDCNMIACSELDSCKSEELSAEGYTSTASDVFRTLSSSDWPNIVYDVSSQDVSVHIPLHRLLSLLLQRALRCYGQSEVTSTATSNPLTSLSPICDDFFGRVLGGCHPCGFSAFVMEHPLRNRVFCAEIHAGMWRKNGDAAILSFEWYRSVRWSEQGLELDLFLLQCCAALAPAELYVNRILERFGLSDYLSLKPERTSEYETVLVQEMLTLIIQIIQERRHSGLTPDENLKRELIHKLIIGDATRSQLMKPLPRDLSKNVHFQEILDTVASYSNPSGINQGMYSLRGKYWKELDLYHPRWNSRELQVAEERYMRYCSVSALTAQLPTWTKIYSPLRGVARIATCKMVSKIIRSVLFYAVFSDRMAEARAPDGILVMALHLLSLGLDICLQQREPVSGGNSIPLLAFAVEEIQEGLTYSFSEQSLLSLLVSLMRMHKSDSEKFSGSDGCNVSNLIVSLLKKFAELDSMCMVKLQELAPEVVIHLSQTNHSNNVTSSSPASDSEKRKEKARERQAAIMAKMKAEQSKFLSSINATGDDESISELKVLKTGGEPDLEESAQDVCSLCHAPNSKNPVSFLIHLQKSRLWSFTDRGPPSWNQARRSDKEQVSLVTNKVIEQAGVNLSSGDMEVDSSNRLSQLVQSAINDFAGYAKPGELISFLEFVRAQFPSLGNIHVPIPLKDNNKRNDRTACTFESMEQDLYVSIRKEMKGNLSVPRFGPENVEFSADEGGLETNSDGNSVLLGKYIAAFSREITEHPSSSDSALDDFARIESGLQVSANEKFGPLDCDGVYLSSCGHAVHQGCLDRYVSSLKERYIRRLIFEGGHIVDPDQGEFLCPVCRRLANSVLPSLPVDFQRVWKEPMISADAARHSVTSHDRSDSLWLPQALCLLQTTANLVEKGDIWKTFPGQRNEKMKQNLDSVSHVLFKMYFPNRQGWFSRSTRANHFIIMWDTLKYSIVSMEIAARSNRTSLAPNYSIDMLHKELKSSSGFVLSLLLKIVHSLRSKNSLHVLQRYRGIQLLARSICSGVSVGHASSAGRYAGDMSSILKQVEKEVPYSDMQFWNQAADPILIHDAFSSLMWVLFCLPQPFLACEESLLSLVHIFYLVSVSQAILAYYGQKRQHGNGEPVFHNCLITDICKVLEQSGWIQRYFVSNFTESNTDTTEVIRRFSFPYLRRCALLWKLLSSSVSKPFCNRDHGLNGPFYAVDNSVDLMETDVIELNEIQKLETLFKIPPLHVVLDNQEARSTVMKWLRHFQKEYEVFRFQHVLFSSPANPFRLMELPRVYQELLERYIKQRCAECNKNILEEPALCLLCGRLCSPHWKQCCRESGCQTHALSCGAGTGVFLLIKRTTIILQRSARQANWPSLYLDAFGEEDIDMHRGKPLYLNEERYAALTCMVASHGLDRNSKVLAQTTIGSFFVV